jgi:hypothetical protein
MFRKHPDSSPSGTVRKDRWMLRKSRSFGCVRLTPPFAQDDKECADGAKLPARIPAQAPIGTVRKIDEC